MKKDLSPNIVENIAIAAVLENENPQGRSWNIYLINLKNKDIDTVLVSSKGYGVKDGQDVKTSVLRHSIGTVGAGDYALVEAIDEQVFGLTNEYWLSYYIEGTIYD